jgi:hypothetical protein
MAMWPVKKKQEQQGLALLLLFGFAIVKID